MSKLGSISHVLSLVSYDSLVLQGLRCEWGAGVLNLGLSLSLFHTGHWKFNMAPHGKKLSEDLKKISVALHKDGLGCKNISKTLKLSFSMVAKTLQWFHSEQASPWSTKQVECTCSALYPEVVWEIDVWVLPALLQRLKGWGVSLSVLRPKAAHSIKIVLHGCHSRRKPLLKMMHKKARKQVAEDKQTKDMDYWNHVLWSDETKIN